jgi:hypothetical protein
MSKQPTYITLAGRQKIVAGDTVVAPQPNSHNAHGYIPCIFKIRVVESRADGVRLKLTAADPEDKNVDLIDIGTYWVPLGTDLHLETSEGEPFIAALWPYRID